jgi:hypothetical protein
MMKLCLEGQFWHDEATVDFPAAPKGQVFWIRRANARRNIIVRNIFVMSNLYSMHIRSKCQFLFLLYFALRILQYALHASGTSATSLPQLMLLLI